MKTRNSFWVNPYARCMLHVVDSCDDKELQEVFFMMTEGKERRGRGVPYLDILAF